MSKPYFTGNWENLNAWPDSAKDEYITSVLRGLVREAIAAEREKAVAACPKHAADLGMKVRLSRLSSDDCIFCHVESQEREECAKLADEYTNNILVLDCESENPIAEAIRARK